MFVKLVFLKGDTQWLTKTSQKRTQTLGSPNLMASIKILTCNYGNQNCEDLQHFVSLCESPLCFKLTVCWNNSKNVGVRMRTRIKETHGKVHLLRQKKLSDHIGCTDFSSSTEQQSTQNRRHSCLNLNHKKKIILVKIAAI